MFHAYSEWSVRNKLGLLVAVAGLGLVVLGAGGTLSLVQQRDTAARALDAQRTALKAVVNIENANVLFKTQSQEFKNILLRGNARPEFDKYLKQFDAAGAKLRTELENGQTELSRLSTESPEIPPLLKELDALNRELHATLADFDANDPQAGQKVDKKVPGRFRKPTTEMDALVAKVQTLAATMSADAVAGLEQEFQQKRNLFAGILALVLGLLMAFAWRIVRGLMEQLGGEPKYAAEVSRRIADGDLGSPIDTRPGDDQSLLAAMKTMQDALKRIVADIRELVGKAGRGDFTGRIDTAGKHGFGQEIGDALNELVSTTDKELSGIASVAEALSAGDLSRTVEGNYQGQFRRTVDAINNTVAVLKGVIQDVQRVVDGASRGDFSARMDTKARQGYALTLAELLNSLNVTAQAALTDISQVSHSLAAGDLSRRIEHAYPGLFGVTAAGLNATIEALHDMVGEIYRASSAIHIAASEISAGHADLSRRTEEQASSLEETAASIEELNSTVQQNADNAAQANASALHSAGIATKGGDSVKCVVETMNAIQGSAHRMADIVGLIDGIAFQTNILALNAAVEAARAQEHGRGFAVVASEVRALSQRSTVAAKDIKTLIDESLGRVDNGEKLVQASGATMTEVVSSFRQVVELVNDITNASQEQSKGIGQIAQAVAQMDEMTQQNAALVEEAAAASESLQDQAAGLVRLVDRFKGVGVESPAMLSSSGLAPLALRGAGAQTSRRGGGMPRLQVNPAARLR